jgi:hypothetical protein
VALVLSIVVFTGCSTQEEHGSMADLVGLLPETIEQWSQSDSTVTFDRETIFDYINGAGEVYRSYAFSVVVVARYTATERSDVLVELFDMGTPDDAYGVFSYAREQEEPGIGGGYEHKGDVLCFWQNRYYVCLALDDPTRGSDTDLTELAGAISSLLPSPSLRPSLVDLLPDDGLVPLSERFFHLHQSLNYHYYLARDNLLNLGSGTDVVFARYPPGTTYLAVVKYESERNAAAAFTSFKTGYMPDAGSADVDMTENGKFVMCRQANHYVVLVLDAESESAADTLMQMALERITQASD